MVGVKRHMVRILSTGLLIAVCCGTVDASVVLPQGLQPGEQYRIAFVTSGHVYAQNRWMPYYNDFVNAAANNSEELSKLDLSWRAIAGGDNGGVTAAANSLTRIGTDDPDLPIYTLDGQLFATGNQQLWSGELSTFIHVDEFGNTVGQDRVWTGTYWNGGHAQVNGYSRYWLGQRLISHSDYGPSVYGLTRPDLPAGEFGYDNWSNKLPPTEGGKWAYAGIGDQRSLGRLYAISDAITYNSPVPEPATIAVWSVLGLCGVGYGVRRKMRRAF